MASAPASEDRLSWQIALGSIASYWLFYVVLGTARTLLVNPPTYQWLYLWLRLEASAASAGITVLLWWALTRSARMPLGRRIAFAALASGVAAAGFAMANASLYRNVPPCGRPGMMATAIAPKPGSIGSPLAAASPGPCDEGWWSLVAEHSITGYFLMAAWAALYLALGYAAEVRRWERRAAALRAAAQTAELRALRYQVNPHFLFNTLNSLSALIMAGRPHEADVTITRLATFFRASLTSDPTADVVLADEIALQRLYLEIEAQRFPSRLRTVFAVPPALADVCVPGMILQPLIENAIRHGVARSRGQTTVTIEARAASGRLTLSVADDARPSDAAPHDGSGVGLRNVADRLAARYGDEARLRAGPDGTGGFVVTLDLPLVRDGG